MHEKVLSQDHWKNIALKVTSSRAREEDMTKMIASLVEQSRLLNATFIDVMDVIWMRLHYEKEH